MTKQRRWLKSVLAASTQPVPALPWARGNRSAAASAAPKAAPQPARPVRAAR